MLNRDSLNAAKARLQKSVDDHAKAAEVAVEACTKLYDLRKVKAHRVICEVEDYVNTMRNKPVDFEKVVQQYKINYSKFTDVLIDIDVSMRDATVKTAAGAGAGVTAGAITALLGPTAAMAVATTFGTASTGTAISALTGVAATKAALAWLGGGAIAAGGGGMAAGTAMLAMSGPVGLGLAGVAATGGILYMRRANAKATKEADERCRKVEAEVRYIYASVASIERLHRLTNNTAEGLIRLLTILRDVNKVSTPHGQTEDVLDMMKAMVNHVRSMGELLVKNVDLKAI
ncbi:hypothetical protein BKE38_08770 [Pseudoroseomonas deserti]|uniref:Uncharacterized protein n=1 Tax=Teichococcus deserti TaxID=1817963 RepID=A0A1V2H489_9PROT|nr:hypothetical protein [Pseudoroseomonas deserti]ONG55750.1 hypothetical protein BKE38_08770 [Pseudoroseomonas deserti]